MTANSLNAHQETILKVLKRGGWKSSSDLARSSGIRLAKILNEMADLIDDGHILLTYAPGRARLPLYHSPIAEAGYLADGEWFMDFQDLPWHLKKSMIAKVDQLYPHKWPAQVPVWARALLAFEEHMVGMNLCDIRPRPREQILFPCWWRAMYMPNPNTWCAHRKKYEFQICFCEVVPPQIAQGAFPNFFSDGPCARANTDLHCIVRERKEGMFVELQHISSARAKQKPPFKLVSCPSREEIVAETTRQLQEGAAVWNAMIPFTPVKLDRQLSLLGDITDRAGANRTKNWRGGRGAFA